MKKIRFVIVIALLSFFMISCDNHNTTNTSNTLTTATTTTTITTTSNTTTDTSTSQTYSLVLRHDSNPDQTIDGINYGDSISLPVLTKVGYTFLGWVYNGITYNDALLFEFNQSITLTALFEINTYAVGFLDYDGTLLETVLVEHGNDVSVSTQPIREGYTFIGWNKVLTNITSSQVITAVYQVNQYTVNFVDYDGTVLKTEIVEYLSDASAPENPSRTGYTFNTWDNDFTGITSDLIINALYTIHQYTVTFDTNGGNPLEPITVDYNTVINLGVTEKVDNYFVNWTFESTVYTDTILVDRDMTLIAVWKSTLADFSYSTHLDDYNNTYIKIDSYNGTDPLVIIPDTYNDLPIRVIGEAAFMSNFDIRKVLIGYNVNIIEDQAFLGCENLIETELNIDPLTESSYLYEIGSHAFSSCNSMKYFNLEVADYFTTIKSNAFSMCFELIHIFINKDIERIEQDAFDNCEKLTIYFEFFLSSNSNAFLIDWNADDCPIVTDVDFFYIDSDITYFYTLDGLLIANVKRYNVSNKIVIPEYVETFGNVTQIADYAFDGSEFESIVLPDTLVEIGKYAFNDCSNLNEIVIPDSVITINEAAFKNCTSITIKCVITEKPVNWDINWNIDDYLVIWGYSQ